MFTLSARETVFVGTANLYNTWDTTDPPLTTTAIIQLENPVEKQHIADVIGSVPGVARIESWEQAKVSLVYENGTDSSQYYRVVRPVDTTITDRMAPQ